jgi:hypothetical protein
LADDNSARRPVASAGRVPLIGRVTARPARTSTRVSGDALATAHPLPLSTPAYRPPGRPATRASAGSGSPV